MEIPTTRELELEVLVRQRDKHITDLQAQVASLKKRVSISEAPQDSQSVTLPPGWVSYLLPRIREARERAVSSGSGAISTALVQRVKALQDENEELYNSLQSSETARLAERVYTLQRAVSKLEGALQESHAAVESLSSELTHYEEILSKEQRAERQRERETRDARDAPIAARSPRRHQTPPYQAPARGSRSYKRPRLDNAGNEIPTINEPSGYSPSNHRQGTPPRPAPRSPRDRRDSHQHHAALPPRPEPYQNRHDAQMDVDNQSSRRHAPMSRPTYNNRDGNKERDRGWDNRSNHGRNGDRVRNRERERDSGVNDDPGLRDVETRSDYRSAPPKKIDRGPPPRSSNGSNGSYQRGQNRGLAERMGL